MSKIAVTIAAFAAIVVAPTAAYAGYAYSEIKNETPQVQLAPVTSESSDVIKKSIDMCLAELDGGNQLSETCKLIITSLNK
jgi:photosystem II stability/assembly factor-like uncharacterized protein